MLPVDTFQIIFLLLEFEYVSHEKLLQIFVGIVDAKLFETVVIKILEAKDIQNPYGAPLAFFWLVNGGVDLFYYKYEQTPVNSFDKGVSDIDTLVSG